MRTRLAAGMSWLVLAFLSAPAFAEQGPNLVEDPSFEIPKERDQFGLVFAKWDGWKYETDDPLELYLEVRDTATRDYWTRVNYLTVAPPGQSTLIVPVKQLYVGEKSRPGRMLMLDSITRLVFSIGDEPKAPLFLDNVRLERDATTQGITFDGLYAFDFGTSSSPIMDGFQAITPSTVYSRGRGYGLKDAGIWRVFDALQPDPLYQDFICIERGGLAVDVLNGRYRVLVNLDSPSGFWGEYQVYRQRAILAEGKPVVTDKMDFAQFEAKYFRFWNVEDSPADNTFDKYQKAYFREKTFEVEVTDGQLNVEFQGQRSTRRSSSTPTSRAGFPCTTTWATSRSATI